MEGLHLTADCSFCQCDIELLTNLTQLGDLVRQTTHAAGLTIVGEKFHQFTHIDGKAAGITGTLLLAESHVAIHTWPERQCVTLDVYVCNFQNDNTHKAHQIIDNLISSFQPQQIAKQQLLRGGKNDRAIEHLSPFTQISTHIDEIIAQVQSPYQFIEIVNSPEFGKIMRIDGAMMTSEKDEFFYHESLVHPAAISHGNPKTALIIGGGDGGSTEELLKYKSIEHITLCEIDAEVITLSRKHLSSIHKNAFDSNKVKLVHTDGSTFIKNNREKYDLILLDLTDPISPNGSNFAESCMSEEFFSSCLDSLDEKGFLALHLGSPIYDQHSIQKAYSRLSRAFNFVYPFVIFAPLYGGQWSMAIACKHPPLTSNPSRLSSTQVQQRIDMQGIEQLQYYNANIHENLFALPSYLETLCATINAKKND